MSETIDNDTGAPLVPRFPEGSKVRVNKPTWREHGVIGTLTWYDPDTKWYWVELDRGPPWRGRYEAEELAPIE